MEIRAVTKVSCLFLSGFEGQIGAEIFKEYLNKRNLEVIKYLRKCKLRKINIKVPLGS